MEDERIITVKNEYAMHTSLILVIGLLVDVIYKYYFKNTSVQNCIGELIILLVGGGYYTFQLIKNGLLDVVYTKNQTSKRLRKYIILGILGDLLFGLTTLFDKSMSPFPNDPTKNIITVFIGLIVIAPLGILYDVFILKLSDKISNKDLE